MPKKRRKLQELAADPRFISGIYNYCDRWCERCAATGRCLTYATLEEEDAADAASRDIRNQAFWQRLGQIFEETEEMLQEMMREHGIELEPDDLEAERAREQQLDAEVRRHACVVAAQAYGNGARAWRAAATPRLEEHAAALARQFEMGLQQVDPEATAGRLRDALEVLDWHQDQIAVKTMRAVRSAAEEDERDSRLPQSDADGSAKVALIGMDRSIAAWAEVLRQLPEQEDALLPLVADLSRLRRDVEAAFPAARSFVRPGFDTGEVPSW